MNRLLDWAEGQAVVTLCHQRYRIMERELIGGLEMDTLINECASKIKMEDASIC